MSGVETVSHRSHRPSSRASSLPPQPLAFSRTGELAASSSWDGTIIFWDPRTGEPLSPPLCDVDRNEELMWSGGPAKNGIWRIAFTPDGRVLASGRQGGTILLWSVEEQAPLAETWQAHDDCVLALAVSPDGRILASGGFHDLRIRLWDLATGALLGELFGHDSAIGGLSFSPDGESLASCDQDRALRLWDVKSRRPLGEVMPERRYL